MHEKSIVRLEGQMLKRLGYQVTERTCSTVALREFKADPDAYDLVVTDMSMPNMTGENPAKEFISIRPDIPIIICTGFSGRINKEKSESIGIKSFMMKPVNKSELAKTIRKILDEKKNLST